MVLKVGKQRCYAGRVSASGKAIKKSTGIRRGATLPEFRGIKVGVKQALHFEGEADLRALNDQKMISWRL
jgi:hypothetical protein